jgi:hypothetical protein
MGRNGVNEGLAGDAALERTRLSHALMRAR